MSFSLLFTFFLLLLYFLKPLPMSLFPSSTILSFFLPYILDTIYLFFLILTSSVLLHFFFYILHILPLLFSFFLLLLLSSPIFLGICHIACSLSTFQEKNLVSSSHGFILPCFYIYHSLYMLLLPLSWSTLFPVGVHLLGLYSLLYSTPVPFPMWDIPASSPAAPFIV